MTQNERVLSALKIGPITQRMMLPDGIYRLASRINDLRYASHVIDTNIVAVTNRDGSTSRIAVYRMVTR